MSSSEGKKAQLPIQGTAGHLVEECSFCPRRFVLSRAAGFRRQSNSQTGSSLAVFLCQNCCSSKMEIWVPEHSKALSVTYSYKLIFQFHRKPLKCPILLISGLVSLCKLTPASLNYLAKLIVLMATYLFSTYCISVYLRCFT